MRIAVEVVAIAVFMVISSWLFADIFLFLRSFLISLSVITL